jgi:DNA-binding transcriptional ArsR family regulator
MARLNVDKRLQRLAESGICTCENVSEYADKLKKMADTAMSAETAKKRSRIFKALADETRLRILGLLAAREMCVCEVMVALELTQPTASHHLGILENAGLVKNRKEGKWVFYTTVNLELVEGMRKLGIQ